MTPRLTLEVDKRTMPFDPHQFRGAGVEIYMFDGQVLRGAESWHKPQYKRLVGVVNESSLSLEEGVATFTGTDYTAIFATQEWDPRDKIQQGKPLDSTIQEILDTVQAKTKGLKITVVFKGDGDPPKVGTGRRKRHQRPFAIKPGRTVWDVASDMAEREGFSLFIDGNDAILQDRGVVTEDQAATIPAVAYGRNLDTMRVSRKFTKDVVPQVIAKGRLPNGEFATEKFPLNPAKANAISGLGLFLPTSQKLTLPLMSMN